MQELTKKPQVGYYCQYHLPPTLKYTTAAVSTQQSTYPLPCPTRV